MFSVPRTLEMPEKGTQKEDVEVSPIQYPDVSYNRKKKKLLSHFSKKSFPQKNQQLKTSFLISFLSTLPNLWSELMR